MTSLPPDFPRCIREILCAVRNVEGWLSDREIHFLALAAACPTTSGRILEIGCYHGKSTIVLAKASELSDHAGLVSVDPISPDHLSRNLQQAGVQRLVEFHQARSQHFLRRWKSPIRLLWHDGANQYDLVKEDLQQIVPHLADGAVVAFHDVLNTSGERIRVYLEEVLASEHFGPVGVCGSIGWGIFRRKPQQTCEYRTSKQRLLRKLKRLLPFHSSKNDAGRLSRSHYRLLRWMVPHGNMSPESWLRNVA